MLKIEHDVTAGGRPILCLQVDTERHDKPLCYLSVTVGVAAYQGTYDRCTFVGLSEEEWLLIRNAVDAMYGVASADQVQ